MVPKTLADVTLTDKDKAEVRASMTALGDIGLKEVKSIMARRDEPVNISQIYKACRIYANSLRKADWQEQIVPDNYKQEK